MNATRLPEWRNCADQLEQRSMMVLDAEIPISFFEEHLGYRYGTQEFAMQYTSLVYWAEAEYGCHFTQRGMNEKAVKIEPLERGTTFVRKLERKAIKCLGRAHLFNHAQLERFGDQMSETERLKRRKKQEQLENKIGYLAKASLIDKAVRKLSDSNQEAIKDKTERVLDSMRKTQGLEVEEED
jgi:hypothetical protein